MAELAERFSRLHVPPPEATDNREDTMSKLEHGAVRSAGEEYVIGVPPVDNACEHVKRLGPVQPSGAGCEKCLQAGDTWVNLRLCMTCGHVGCCDDSKNKHATKHHHATHHPVIKSYQPREDWLWCFVDQRLMV
jgi:uncharacterized UBP type Zn finger protein